MNYEKYLSFGLHSHLNTNYFEYSFLDNRNELINFVFEIAIS